MAMFTSVTNENIANWQSNFGAKSSHLRSLLGRAEFPTSSKYTLVLLEKYFRSCRDLSPEKYPHKDFLLQIIDDFVFYHTERERQSYFRQKLTSIQELQLLELFCSYFNWDCDKSLRVPVFDSLFGGNVSSYKKHLLFKLVSMAVAVKCGPVLECAAFWILDQGSRSNIVLDLVDHLLHDYSVLLPKSLPYYRTVAHLSPLFTNQLLQAYTSIYTMAPRYHGGNQDGSQPPAVLLDLVKRWVTDCPDLFLESLTHGCFRCHSAHNDAVKMRPMKDTPFLGLATWAICSPLVEYRHLGDLEGTGSEFGEIFSLLHWRMLNVLLDRGFSSRLQDIFKLDDIETLVDTVCRCRESHTDTSEQCQLAVDRFAQFIQVAMTTGALVCSTDQLENVCLPLPDSKLLQLILTVHADTSMEH